MKSVENILKQRDAFGATLFDIGEHTPIAGIKRGIQAFKDAGADIIVSVGGGSPIDASKAILHNIQQESGGPFFKQIAVPTTLSAAEYTVSVMYWAGGCMVAHFCGSMELDIPVKMVIKLAFPHRPRRVSYWTLN